jgi:hypothetical protein
VISGTDTGDDVVSGVAGGVTIKLQGDETDTTTNVLTNIGTTKWGRSLLGIALTIGIIANVNPRPLDSILGEI